jgi:hypothetical protein
MRKRRSKEEWDALVKDYKISGLSLTAWCREKGISKSSIYPYLKKFNREAETCEQKWGAIIIPKIIESPSISVKVGDVTLDIKKGFDKGTLADVLSVVINLC